MRSEFRSAILDAQWKVRMLADVTPLILTFNEEPNIRRTLEKLTWAREVLIVDSFSTDHTLEIAAAFPNVRTVQRVFDSHAAQWNFGLEKVQTLWVLALDADYVLSSGFIHELQNLNPSPGSSAFYVRFVYCVAGRPLSRSIYPARAVLFRRDRCRYYQDGHTQQLEIDGGSQWFEQQILHDDRKCLSAWLEAQSRYAYAEVHKLTCTPDNELGFPDRIRKRVLYAPLMVCLHTLFIRGLILDGWAGLHYAFQRTVAELILSIKLIECKFAVKTSSEPSTLE